MAIVKFVSDKNCQVFIDMEQAGKVTPDSMLKVTLETGGYLIQVKDEDGNLIKEYDLEIKPSDNQLLHKIDGANNKLDDTIENLKNDSSLVFHCDRASFSHNGLYGFVDKKLNVVIPPIYYSVNEFVDDKAFVVRDFPEGRKTTMIDSDGNIFFNRWFDYIGESDNTILLGIDNRIIVYSKTKCNKITEYFNAGYDYKYPIVPVYKKEGVDEFYGFINFEGKEVVPLLFDRIWNYDGTGNAKVFYFGFYDTIDNIRFKLQNHLKYNENREINTFEDLLYYYLFPFNNYSYTDCNCLRYDIEIERINKKWTLTIHSCNLRKKDSGNETKIECDKVLYVGDGCYAYRDGLISTVVYLEPYKKITFDFSYIIPANIVYNNGTFDKIYKPDTFIFRKDGRYGLIDLKGNIIFNPIYDNIEIIHPNCYDSIEEAKVLATIKQGHYYSIANLSEGKIYLPFEYDEITYIEKSSKVNDCVFLLCKNNIYTLYSGIKCKIISDHFDEFILGPTNIVRKANKYGIIDDMGNVLSPIEHDNIFRIGKENYIIDDEDLYAFGNLGTEDLAFFEKGTIISILYSDEDDEIFLVGKDGKYGCIDRYGEILEYIIYDKIEVESKVSCSPAIFALNLYKNGEVTSHKLRLHL